MKTQIETTPGAHNAGTDSEPSEQRIRLKRRMIAPGLLALFVIYILAVWLHEENRPVAVPSPLITSRSLEDIVQSGHITVITLSSPYSYYEYRKEKKGFEYDLAAEFAKYLGVELRIWVSERREKLVPDLLEGKGDFIAANLVMTPRDMDRIGFSDGYLQVQHQMVVPRGNETIDSPQDLSGKIVHVEQGSGHQADLEALLSNGISLEMVTHPTFTTEELIGEVEDKKIEVTIADNHIALLNRRYYPKISISGTLNAEEAYRWAFPPESWKLAFRINHFFSIIKSNGRFSEIYDRYFDDIGFFDYLGIRAFHHRIASRLPDYRHWIEEAASIHGFDWRLIAALIYQESQFDPEVISQDGAHGLMQITPSTGECFGVKDLFDPRENIQAGILQLKSLYDLYDKAEDPDRLFLALSAYNVGQGHVKDARDLARSKNLNPDKWASIEETLLLLEEPDYYLYATYGYCRGTEPVTYVQQIKIYYDILRRKGIELSRGNAAAQQGL